MTFLSLKTKLHTQKLEESQAFYVDIFGMVVVESWDSDGDRGVILGFTEKRTEALLELYDHPTPVNFDNLSLQFRVEDVDRFVEGIKGRVDYDGPKPRPWGARYVYLRDPNGVLLIVYEGCL